MRILNGKPPAQNSDGQPQNGTPAAAAPAAAAPAEAAPAAAFYEYRDPLLSPSTPSSHVPAAAQHPRQEEPKGEKKEKPLSSPLGRRPRAAREVNSDDERLQKPHANTEETLLTLLQRKGFQIRKMAEDGNCLFRAIADQVYGDPEMHDVVRKNAMDFVEKERGHFSQWVTEDIAGYISRKRQPGVFGNNIEIQACIELYNRPCEVYSAVSGEKPLNIFQTEYQDDSPPIRLSYHNGNHYNSVIDPLNPSVGVGLGLPNLQPGLADRQQMDTAKRESEAAALEQELTRAVAESAAKEAEQDVDRVIAESEADAIEASLLKEALQQSKPAGGLSDWVADDDMDAAVRMSMEQFIADAVKGVSQAIPPKKS